MTHNTAPITTPEQLLSIMGHTEYPESLRAAEYALLTPDPEWSLALMLHALENGFSA